MSDPGPPRTSYPDRQERRRDYARSVRRHGPVRGAVCSTMVLAMVGLLAVLWPTDARACACCDGWTSRQIVGWSKTGRSLLVRHEDYTHCIAKNSLELWRVGHRRPAGCYDLHGDPDRKKKCSDLSEGQELGAPLRTSSVERKFTPGEPVAQRYVRSWRRTNGLDEEHFETHEVVVELWTGTAWHEVWRGDIGEHRYPGVDEQPEMSAPIAVEVWPTPSGERAALVVHNAYSDPLTGHFSDLIHWVDVPEGTRALTDLRGASPSWQGESVPVLGAPSQWQERRLAARENARGLRLHREGKFGAAAPRFIEALRLDAGNTMARYNLACALAREGLWERSLTVLEELRSAAADGSCPKCRGRIERAAEDEDFAALRGDPRFAAIIGPELGTPTHPSSPPATEP